MKEALRERALSLGFDAAGFARLSDLGDHTAAYREWVTSGRNAWMGSFARSAEQRGAPAARNPWARTVLMVAVSYNPPVPSPLPGSPRFGVSRYAWGPDYHGWIGPRLDRLAAWVQAQGLGRIFTFCDRSAVPEKPLAALAGLGHLGRHTLLITPRFGSWVFLGGLFLEADLPPDAPLPRRCPPSCTACRSACPTRALDEAGLDARRCLSYWSTHAGREVPPEVAPHLERARYGCDLCQQACPLNARAAFATNPSLAPSATRNAGILKG
jgi:epoxyqueuosine reductase